MLDEQLLLAKTIEYKKPITVLDSQPESILNNSEIANVIDNTLEIDMAPGQTRQFSEYLGPYRIADSYYDIFREKPDFTTFHTDKIEGWGSLLAAFGDYI